MDDTNDKTRGLRKEFSELPFETKVSTLTQLEILIISEAFDIAADTTAAWAKKIFDVVMPEECSAHQTESQPTRPTSE